MTTIASLVLAYLLGSVPFAVLVSLGMGLADPRSYGSGNPGATNVLRSGNKLAALLTLLGDAAKGWLAVWLAQTYGASFGLAAPEIAMVGLAVFIGHLWPVFLAFRGGKGVATLVGAIMGVNAPLVLLCFGVWFLVLMITHYVSLASMVAGCSFPIFTLISPKVNHLVPFVVFSFIIAILLIYTHRKNIERLKAGTESKIYIWKPRHVKVDPEEAKDKGANK